MDRMTKLFGSLAALLLATTAWCQIDASKTIVTVNGDAISTGTYFKRMEVLPGVGSVNSTGQFVSAMPGFLTLQRMINEHLMIQLSRKNGVEPTSAEIDAEIESKTKQNPNFVKGFLQSGLTMDDLKYDVKVQLAEFKVTTMGVTITDFQVKKFYDDNPRQFTLPKRYTIRVIATSDADKKKAIDAELQKKTPFADVATKYSEDISRLEGGLVGTLSEDVLGDNMKTIVTNLKEGEVTPWLKGQNNTEIKVYVEKILPSEVVKYDDNLKKDIWRRLMTDRGRVKNDVNKMMADMRKNAKIEYTGTPFDQSLKDYFGGI